jgi:hypothetical protein
MKDIIDITKNREVIEASVSLKNTEEWKVKSVKNLEQFLAKNFMNSSIEEHVNKKEALDLLMRARNSSDWILRKSKRDISVWSRIPSVVKMSQISDIFQGHSQEKPILMIRTIVKLKVDIFRAFQASQELTWERFAIRKLVYI